MTAGRVLIYGATGFTGRLIAREARVRGLDAILAGRDASRVDALARSLGLPWRAARLESLDEIATALGDVAVVLNVAGPLGEAAVPFARKSIAAGCHFLDISGEVETFRGLSTLDQPARDNNVMVMSSVGFCSVASSFLARRVVDVFPAATSLRAAISFAPSMSRGSMTTMFGALREGVTIVRDRVARTVAVGQLERNFEFGAKRKRLACTAASLADTISTARATGSVRNVEFYIEAGMPIRTLYQAGAQLSPFTQMQPGKSYVEMSTSYLPGTVGSGVASFASLVVEAEDAWLQTRAVRLETDDTYRFTTLAACTIAELVSSGVAIAPGFHGPAERLYGHPAMDKMFTEASRWVP